MFVLCVIIMEEVDVYPFASYMKEGIEVFFHPVYLVIPETHEDAS